MKSHRLLGQLVVLPIPVGQFFVLILILIGRLEKASCFFPAKGSPFAGSIVVCDEPAEVAFQRFHG